MSIVSYTDTSSSTPSAAYLRFFAETFNELNMQLPLDVGVYAHCNDTVRDLADCVIETICRQLEVLSFCLVQHLTVSSYISNTVCNPPVSSPMSNVSFAE